MYQIPSMSEITLNNSDNLCRLSMIPRSVTFKTIALVHSEQGCVLRIGLIFVRIKS